ncbi:CheR family methyltransferase [Rhodocytophaga aerolata]|uniref:protein-glutamate O-methyltransferase n=1 Tax=Rhodocytophaga aerolata TaxID=455078 RepID=A0ABT8QYQ7_9BACT|nr:CheR family methyltransferase [Rhodocytophaga aerolata]MDO1444981.1 CheR family methyltransferase [Rhodocytophaga aerolata]
MVNGKPLDNNKLTKEEFLEEWQVDVQQLKNRAFPIVGIGGSAGALDSFKEFFSTIPSDTGMAFVLVQHLDPTMKSMLPELLQRNTPIPVVAVADGLQVEPNHIYVIPENTEMVIFNGRLLLFKPTRPRGLRMPIDTFFQSLAADWGEKAAGIIFSGMGSDGELGARFIKKGLGLVIAQDPKTASYDSMPRSVIDTNSADYVLAPKQMAEKLLEFIKKPYQHMQKKNAFDNAKVVNTLQKVLQLLRSHTGHDFSLYKPNTIFRRLERRLHTHQLTSMEEYVEFLHNNPGEIDLLLQDMLIGVTKFFRDYPAFKLLEDKILPNLLKNKSKDKPLRIWVAGCSTGEEAYSLAIIIKEFVERSKAKQFLKIQFYATDLAHEAIEKARKGVYYSNIAADISPERLHRYFVKQGNLYQINQEIREMIVFAQHNLVSDPIFTKLDLLCCRNVFIYFNPELQKKLLPIFHFALNPEGVLFLGPSENIQGSETLFDSVDLKWKLYKRRLNTSALADITDFPGKNFTHVTPKDAPAERELPIAVGEYVKRVLLREHTPAAVLINDKGDIIYINGRISPYLELMPGEVEVNIFSMATEKLAFDLRNAVKQAITKQEVVVSQTKIKANGKGAVLKLTVKYLKNPEEIKGLLLVVFEELPLPAKRPKTTSLSALTKQDLEEKEEEIKLLREQLQQIREERDVTVEEIKSANEELQSTNEELQSTNEEAISAREELQSMNEELMTVNTELREKTDQLTEINNDIVNLLNSSHIATIFVDTSLHIRRFTPAASQVMNLIATDIGRPLVHIRSTLQYNTLIKDLQEVINCLIPTEKEIQSDDGKYYSVRILPYRTTDNYIYGAVINFVDITSSKVSQQKQQESLLLMENIVDSIRDPMLVLDGQKRVIALSRAFRKIFRVTEENTKGRILFELGNGEWNIDGLKQLLDKVIEQDQQEDFNDFIVEKHFPKIGFKRMKLHGRHIVNRLGHQQDHLLLLTIEDITSKQ